ncbi:MAG: nucleotidyltransferase family protein, partial [Acutalibacteraceae bacterium]|nr:nucleotidyltransferase family protein [Acutalibacteraceae bacterium]
LYCGSECGDTARLEQAAQAVADTAVENTLRHYLREGITYAAAREKAVRRLYGEETAAVLTNPNDILGTEYAKALHRLHSPIQLHTIQRVAVAHDSDTPDGQFASASYLRQQLYQGQTIDVYIPSSVKALFNAARQHLSGDRNKVIEPMLLYRLRTMTPQDFAALPDISEGLENRLYEAVRSCISIDGILSYVKSKRYPLSRLRRLLLYAFLQWTQADCEELPPYIQVLGFSRQGQDILHEAKKSASLPLITRHADTACLTDEGKRFYALMCRCDDLYALTGATVLPCGVTQRTRIIFDKNIPL